MSRRRILLAALAGLAACQGSDTQPLEPLGLDRFGDQASLVAGGGRADTFGHTGVAGTLPTLRLARFDPAESGRTIALGDVTFGGGGAITRLAVTDEAAAVVVGGAAYVVDLGAAPLAVVAWPALGGVDDLAVSGRWLLAASGSDLTLADRETSVVLSTFTAPGPPTALLPTPTGFLAFTASGYVVVEASDVAPVFTEVVDPVLRDLRSAFPDAGGAVAAGPAPAIGRARVVRLDLNDPLAPAVVRSHEVAGTYVAFAWDGEATAILAVHGAGDGAGLQAFHEGWRLRETAGGFEAAGLPLTSWAESRQPLAARSGHLLAVSAPGLLLLRIR